MSDRVAIVGCGAAARWIHLPSFARIGWEPVLLVDPDLERAMELGASFGVQAVREFESHLDDFDAALIATPHTLHADLACSLLEAGKHVFVEKPLATTSAETRRIVATEERAEASLTVGLMRRQLVAAEWVKRLLDSGALGSIQSVDARDGFVYEWMTTSDAIWRKASAGGGVLFDLGPHVLDLLMWWLGPLEVTRYRDDSYGGVEADCVLEVSTSSGGKGVIELSRTRSLRQSAIIRGHGGTVEVGLDSNRLRLDPAVLAKRRFGGVRGKSIGAQSYEDLFDAQLRDWHLVLHGRQPPAVPARDALEVIELIEHSYGIRQQWSLPWVRIPPEAKDA